MEDGEDDTDDVDEDPEEVEDVMSIGSLYEGAGGLCRSVVYVCCHCSTQEGWAKVDGDGSKPGD